MEKTALEVKTNRNVSLDYLRVIAMFMVLFSHLGLMRNPSWFIGNIIKKELIQPLILIQDFGKFAVCLFFLITGFFFIPSLKRAKSAFVFIFNRIIPLYILVVITTFLFFVFQKTLRIIFPFASWWEVYTAKQWICGGTLLDIFKQGYPFNPPLWYLIPTMVFTILGAIIFKNDSYVNEYKKMRRGGWYYV